MREQMHQQQLWRVASDSRITSVTLLEPESVQKQLAEILRLFDKEQMVGRSETALSLARSLGMIGLSFSPEKPLTAQRSENMRQLDLLPHLLFESEWQKIEQGLIQRATAFQAFLRDIYGEREILKNEVVPVPLILGNPRFRRECVDLRPPENFYFRIAAFDLTKEEKTGEWKIVRDHFSVPMGIAYALQNRRLQSQIFSELFSAASVLPISQFTTELLENLQFYTSPSGEEKHIAMLSESGWEGEDFEHSFLARKMGFTLVQPQDLVVRAGALHYRTIHGLKPVHAIFRCVDGSVLDPVSFQEAQGTPGLMSCLRQGSVVVINAIGSGAAESRALFPFSERIIRFYLNEDALLKTLPTQLCTDPDEWSQIHEQMEKYELARCDNRPASRASLIADFENKPEQIVAHPRFKSTRLPLLPEPFSDSHRQPFSLRCFVLCSQDRTVVLPGGLTMVWPGDDWLNETDYIAKDTWVIAPEFSSHPVTMERPAWVAQQRPLGSRTAESLFWMGRYCERAEFTARMFGVLEEVRLENSYFNSERWFPLWNALSKVTGHQAGFFREPASKTPPHTANYILFDTNNYASILNSIRRAHQNAGTLLDYISPEAWTIINKLEQRLSQLASPSLTNEKNDENKKDEALPSPGIREAVEATLNQLAAFRGMTSRTMLHDLGNRFFNAGLHMERCLLTLASVEQIFSSINPDEPEDEDWENPLLNALLRILGTLDAYRRTFQKRAETQSVAQMILLQEQAPVSIFFCVNYLERLVCSPESECVQGCQKVHQIFDQLRQANLQQLLSESPDLDSFGNSSSPFIRWIRSLIQQTEEFYHHISDAFFLHQGDGSQIFTGTMNQ